MFKDKTFKYFTSQPPGKVGSKVGGTRPLYPHEVKAQAAAPTQQSAAPPGPARAQNPRARDTHTVPPPKSRVRVPGNAGDKCVPPAKSRPKKRKSVKGGENALGMDAVEWSDQTYSVKQLVAEFGDRFPVIVKVNQGYYGSCGDLSLQQVLQIHSCGKQKRVLATDSHKKKVTIPTDYPMDAYVRLGDGGERMTLANAISTHPLPIKLKVVHVADDPEFEDDSYCPAGEELRLSSIEETPFLRANSIMDGWVDQLDIYLIPCFLGAEFSVATGMRGASEDEWLDYHGMFARSVRHLNYQMLTGYKGIIVDGQLPSSARTSHMGTAPGPLHLDHALAARSPPVSPTQGQVYENLPESEPRRLASSSSSSSSSAAAQYENVNRRRVERSSTLPPSSQDTFHFTLEGGERVTSLDPPPSNNPYSEPSPPVSPNQISAEVEVHNRRNLDPGSPNTAPSPGPSLGEEDVEEMFASVISVAMEEEEKRERESTLTREGHENPAFSEGDAAETPPHYRTPANYSPQDSIRPANNNNPPPPKAVVQPRVQTNNNNEAPPHVVTLTIEDTLTRDKNTNTYINVGKPRATTTSQGGNVTTSRSNINTMEDVPTHIDTLTVADVCACLTLLNMENHVKEFQKRQVDGNLLNSLKENVLINEFRLTPFSASKLMRFSRGWRPKFT